MIQRLIISIFCLLSFLTMGVHADGYHLVHKMGAFGSGQGNWSAPGQMAIFGSSLYVLDSGNNRIANLDFDLTWKFSFGYTADPQDRMSHPSGICVGVSRTLWVAESGSNRLRVFSSDGVYQKSVGDFGISDLRFSQPSALGSDGFGNIYVCDTGNDRIVVLNKDGEFVSDFGQVGEFDQRLFAPSAIAVLPDGRLIVADHSENPLKIFDFAGNCIGTIGISGPKKARQIAAIVPDDACIWVADTASAEVRHLDLSGHLLDLITDGLKAPVGIAIQSQTIYISDQRSNGILMYTKKQSYPKLSL